MEKIPEGRDPVGGDERRDRVAVKTNTRRTTTAGLSDRAASRISGGEEPAVKVEQPTVKEEQPAEEAGQSSEYAEQPAE